MNECTGSVDLRKLEVSGRWLWCVYIIIREHLDALLGRLYEGVRSKCSAMYFARACYVGGEKRKVATCNFLLTRIDFKTVFLLFLAWNFDLALGRAVVCCVSHMPS